MAPNPPRNRLIRQTVRPAPDPLTQFVANVKGYTAGRAHGGLETMRSAPSPLERGLDLMGVPATGARQAMGGMQVLTSPVGGLGQTVGQMIWPNPGDPRPARLGNVAEMVTPIPGEKLAEGANAARKLTGAATNALMRPRVARTASEAAEVADQGRRAFLKGAAGAGAAAVVGAPLIAKGIEAVAPKAAEAVAPDLSAAIAAAHRTGSSFHEAALRAWSEHQDLLYALKHGEDKPSPKMLKDSLDSALAETERAVQHTSEQPFASLLEQQDVMTPPFHVTAGDLAAHIREDAERGSPPIDPYEDVIQMMTSHMNAAAEHRKAMGPYAHIDNLNAIDLEHVLRTYREDPESAHDIMDELESPHPRTEAGWADFANENPEATLDMIGDGGEMHPAMRGDSWAQDNEYFFNHGAIGDYDGSFSEPE